MGWYDPLRVEDVLAQGSWHGRGAWGQGRGEEPTTAPDDGGGPTGRWAPADSTTEAWLATHPSGAYEDYWSGQAGRSATAEGNTGATVVVGYEDPWGSESSAETRRDGGSQNTEATAPGYEDDRGALPKPTWAARERVETPGARGRTWTPDPEGREVDVPSLPGLDEGGWGATAKTWLAAHAGALGDLGNALLWGNFSGVGDAAQGVVDAFGQTGLGQALGSAWNGVGELGQAAAESPAGQTVGGVLGAVGNAAGWMNENLPTRAAMRELAGWDEVANEVGPDHRRLEELLARYHQGDRTVGPEIEALSADLNRRMGEDSGKPLSERLQEAARQNPDLWKYDLLHDLLTGAAAGLIAPGAEAGAARNLAGLALDPVGQGLGLAGEGAAAGLRGAAGLGRGAEAAESAAGRGLRDGEGEALGSTRRAIDRYSEAEQAVIDEQLRQLHPEVRAANLGPPIPHLDDPSRSLEFVDVLKMPPEERTALAQASYLPHFGTGASDALDIMYDALGHPAEKRGRLAGLANADGWYGATQDGREIYLSPWAVWSKADEEHRGDLAFGGYNTFRRHVADEASDVLVHEIAHTMPLPEGVEAHSEAFETFVQDLRRKIGQERLKAAEQALADRLKPVLSNEAHVERWGEDTTRIRRQEGALHAARQQK